MTFQLTEDGFECETVNNEMYYIQFDIIQKISSYTYDAFGHDECRLEIETTDSEAYTFSEKEDGWPELIEWIQGWANLPANWQEFAYEESFSSDVTVLWQLTHEDEW